MKKKGLQCNLKLKLNSIDPRHKALLTIVAQDAVAKFLTRKYHTVSQLAAGRTTVGYTKL